MRIDEVTKKNIVVALVFTEDGCCIDDGEFGVFISQFVGFIGADDYQLVREAIDECVSDLELPYEGVTEVRLVETGEWDPHPIWHKYYQIVSHDHIVIHQNEKQSADDALFSLNDWKQYASHKSSCQTSIEGIHHCDCGFEQIKTDEA